MREQKRETYSDGLLRKDKPIRVNIVRRSEALSFARPPGDQLPTAENGGRKNKDRHRTNERDPIAPNCWIVGGPVVVAPWDVKAISQRTPKKREWRKGERSRERRSSWCIFPSIASVTTYQATTGRGDSQERITKVTWLQSLADMDVPCNAQQPLSRTEIDRRQSPLGITRRQHSAACKPFDGF